MIGEQHGGGSQIRCAYDIKVKRSSVFFMCAIPQIIRMAEPATSDA